MPLSAKFFVDPALVQRSVTLPDGSTETLHFRRLSFTQMCAYAEAKNSADPAQRHAAIAHMLAQSVCEPDGSLAMSYEVADTLNPKGAKALLDVVLALNDFDMATAKKPSPRTGEVTSGISGTPSPSPSAAEA